jgi:hypothetical protein
LAAFSGVVQAWTAYHEWACETGHTAIRLGRDIHERIHLFVVAVHFLVRYQPNSHNFGLQKGWKNAVVGCAPVIPFIGPIIFLFVFAYSRWTVSPTYNLAIRAPESGPPPS